MKSLLHFLMLIALCSALGVAQIPRTLSYQGVLTDSAGTPRPDGSYTFTFSLYNSLSGGVRLWSETKPLNLKRGLFSTALGEVTPFPDSLKFDQPYWLNISVSGIGELTPRSPLTSVGYSMNALRADTAKITLSTDSWISNENNVYVLDRNVGIGTPSPIDRVTIQRSYNSETFSTSFSGNAVTFDRPSGGLSYIDKLDGGPIQFRMGSDVNPVMTIKANGTIGIGTASPSEIVTVQGRYGGETFFTNFSGNAVSFTRPTGGLSYIDKLDGGPIQFRMGPSLSPAVTVNADGNVYISGHTSTPILEITGSDFAEPFEMSETDTLSLGSLVVIDPDNPGKLKQSTQAYDKRVAGVISGAGGIYPGIMVSKEGKAKNSQYVAMSGKVYALATASNGAIEPGDLLTTSTVAGHAMKATDETKSHGTIIGKAMSSLNEGEGLVLVLVNLQ